MVDHYGLEVVQAYMIHVQDAAEEAVRASLVELSIQKGLPEMGVVEAVDYLDDGSPIVLKLTIDRQKAARISISRDRAGTVGQPQRAQGGHQVRHFVQSEMPYQKRPALE